MNAHAYYQELTEEAVPTIQPQFDAILNVPLPAFRANIRHQTRKEWAAAVRKLFKDLKLTGISVTTPSYSMAQSIHISIPDLIVDRITHDRIHDEIWSRGGHAIDCPDCAKRWNAHNRIEEIVLAAFPDLGDRSDSQSDHFDYCLSIR